MRRDDSDFELGGLIAGASFDDPTGDRRVETEVVRKWRVEQGRSSLAYWWPGAVGMVAGVLLVAAALRVTLPPGEPSLRGGPVALETLPSLR
jgi:hypothetical protein